MKSIEEKAQLWDYYQDLIKSSGFDGITDLLAENKRLQAIIDAANAQPVCEVVQINQDRYLSLACVGAVKPKIGDKLYIQPIPTQQSPAVMVPDDGLIDQIKNIWWKAKSSHLMRTDTAREIIQSVLYSSPRITEQDALEIAENHYRYRRNKAANNIGSGFSNWFTDEGHELLAKLNNRV